MNFAVWGWRLNGFSGVERYHVDLARGLIGAGHQVTIHLNHGDGEMADMARRAGARIMSWEDRGEPADVNIAQVRGPTDAALLANRAPIIQVVHSEHPHECPLDDARVRSVVFVRRGAMTLALRNWRWLRSDRVIMRVIRNPVVFGDFERIPPMHVEWGGAFCSEVDRFKMKLLRLYAEYCAGSGERVVVIGRVTDPEIADELPENVDVLGHRMYPAWDYPRARHAFSFRLSRTVVEAHLLRRPVMVYGGMEPSVAAYDADLKDPIWLPPGEFDIEPFRADRVAGEFASLAQECLA